MTIYYLYMKTHVVSGLKYLGKTKKSDPHKYRGSGIRWKNHIKKYGYDVKTEILLQTEDYSELVETGLFFSNLFNIVKSDEWANLIPESGEGIGGFKHSDATRLKLSESHTGKRKMAHSEETRQKIAESLRGRTRPPFTEEHRRKTSETLKGVKRKPFTEEHRRKISEAKTGKPRGKTIP